MVFSPKKERFFVVNRLSSAEPANTGIASETQLLDRDRVNYIGIRADLLDYKEVRAELYEVRAKLRTTGTLNRKTHRITWGDQFTY